MYGSVTALLVSHDGSRWLPHVLAGLDQQSVAPSAVVAVDTGSVDGTPELLRRHLPAAAVLELPRTAGYPEAVRAGLARLPPAGPDDWVWLLHDDSAPAPDALERLLAAAGAPGAPELLGPKLREWPSLRRLLEVGVTISGTGRRETWLEPGEVDQGQHDTARDVLAVNTAGLLVRRTVLETLGLDDELPVIHTDLDLGWRAVRAGLRVGVVPDAVVFHAEASRTGVRRPDQSRAARRRRDGEARLYTVLANCRTGALPFVVVRLFLGTLLRCLGLLLVRAPAEAWAELTALGATVLRPRRVARARRVRRPHLADGADARGLLAPAWLPYRHGLDEVTEIVGALTREATLRTGGGEGRASLGRRMLSSPPFWLFLVLLVLAVVAARDQLGTGRLVGGALLPAPDSALDWWHAYFSTTHDVATGSSSTAPAYLLPMALLGSLLLGSASAAVDLLVLGVGPLAGLGGYRFLRRVGASRLPATWGAATYAVLPALGGAVAQGRLGTLAVAVLLPWLATSALGLLADSADRRLRAAWRTSVWLAVASAFAPLLWLVALVVTVAATAALAAGRRGWSTVAPVLLPVPAAALLLLPWSALVWSGSGWAALVREAGLAAPALVGPLDGWDVLGARAATSGAAPVWIGAATAALATLALLRPGTRGPVVTAWALALVSLGALWWVVGRAPEGALGLGSGPVWPGVPVLVAQAAWVTAVALGATGTGASWSWRSLGWRQPVGLVVLVAALMPPVAGAAWWAGEGNGSLVQRLEPDSDPDRAVPAYLDDAFERSPSSGTAVLRGTVAGGVTVELRHGAPLSLGEEAILPTAEAQQPLTRAVGGLLGTPGPGAVAELAGQGVAYVFAATPVDPDLAGRLDALPELASASAAETGGRAWQLDAPTTRPGVDAGAVSWLRPLLVAGQVLALLTVVVLAAPSRRRTGP